MINFQQYYAGMSSDCRQKKIPISSSLGVYFGTSDDGFLRLSFLSKETAPRLESTRALRVMQGEESNGIYWTCFDLLQIDAKTVFFTFCDNMVESVAEILDENRALMALKKRYIAWKSMFKGMAKPTISHEAIQGLYGELFFLRHYMIERYGVTVSINGWSGPDSKSKDFSIDRDWYEIKTVGANAISVHISSLSQLSSEDDGCLVVIKVESMSAEYKGEDCSIGALMSEILTLIKDETLENVFLNKLSAYGVELLDTHMTEKFNVKSVVRYKVDDRFPRITESDVRFREICDVSYSLIIGALSDYSVEGGTDNGVG